MPAAQQDKDLVDQGNASLVERADDGVRVSCTSLLSRRFPL